MMSAFFSDEAKFIEKLAAVDVTLRNKKMLWISIFFSIIIVLAIFLWWRSRVIGKRMTMQIVDLYENLNEMITTSKKGGKGGTFKFKPASKEVN